jgi:acetolactate synthase regulatory subunit
VNTFTLQIRVRQADGGLERILGVTRRRRFELQQMAVNTTDDGAHLDVDLTVRGERPGISLVRQLEKLEDVSAVTLAAESAELAGARSA